MEFEGYAGWNYPVFEKDLPPMKSFLKQEIIKRNYWKKH